MGGWVVGEWTKIKSMLNSTQVKVVVEVGMPNSRGNSLLLQLGGGWEGGEIKSLAL